MQQLLAWSGSQGCHPHAVALALHPFTAIESNSCVSPCYHVQQLLAWFDPHGFHSQLPLLQSTPAALAALTQHRHAAHAPVHRHVHNVSPPLAAALGQALSAGARRIMAQPADFKPARCAVRLRHYVCAAECRSTAVGETAALDAVLLFRRACHEGG